MLLFLTSGSAYSQPANNKPPLFKDFNHQNKIEKNTGYILLGSGITAIVVPIIMAINEYEHGEEDFTIGFISMGVGIALVACSVPILVMERKNKRKEASLFIKNEKVIHLQNDRNHVNSIPALSISVTF